MEQDTIRTKSIGLVNEHGERTMTLDGGGNREPGIVICGPKGPMSAVTLLVRRENEMPYIMVNTAIGTVVQFTFDRTGRRRQRQGHGRRGPQGLSWIRLRALE